MPEDLVPTAIAWATGAFQTASIVGPSIGGLLYAFGPAVPYAMAGGPGAHRDRLHRRHAPGAQARARGQPATFASMFSGIRFIRRIP